MKGKKGGLGADFAKLQSLQTLQKRMAVNPESYSFR